MKTIYTINLEIDRNAVVWNLAQVVDALNYELENAGLKVVPVKETKRMASDMNDSHYDECPGPAWDWEAALNAWDWDVREGINP
jgi:hypothetical protein